MRSTTSTGLIFTAALSMTFGLAVPQTSRALDMHASLRAGSNARIFTSDHRFAVRRFLLEQSKDCPAKLINKDGFCTPAASERMWLIGRPLSKLVEPLPVPSALTARLPRTRPGHAYGFVNGDVVLYETTTRLVLDAVVWSS